MYTTLHPSPVGDILLKADGEGRLTDLYLRHDATEAGDGPFDAVREQLDAYFAGELEEFDLPLALHGTEFQLRVWDQLARIPFAETISYKELALRLGDLKLVRAVGLANGRNPDLHRHPVSPRHRRRRHPGRVRRRARSQALAARPRGCRLGTAPGRRLTYQVESNVPGR